MHGSAILHILEHLMQAIVYLSRQKAAKAWKALEKKKKNKEDNSCIR